MQSISLDVFLKNCKSGDIILFNGKKWYSKLIEWYCGSDISHVGIIVIDPNIDGKMTHGHFLLESKLYSNDKNGVRLTPLRNIFKENEGSNVYIRFLNCIRDSKFKLRIDNICFVTLGKKYDDSPFDWIKVICDIDIGNDQKTSKFWCSALVAYSYILLGLLNPKIPWTLIKPSDFSSRIIHSVLNFNCDLSEDILIDYQEQI